MREIGTPSVELTIVYLFIAINYLAIAVLKVIRMRIMKKNDIHKQESPLYALYSATMIASVLMAVNNICHAYVCDVPFVTITRIMGGAVLLIALYVGDILTWRELVVKRYYGHGNPDLSGACSINKRDGK